MKKHNFNAGPSILPESVIIKAKEALIDFDNSGLSILEISHRHQQFVSILEKTTAAVKSIYNLGDDYEVFFMQGGASAQFAILPMNFLNAGNLAAYANTGTWASKAIHEAQLLGNVFIASDSSSDNFRHIPPIAPLPESTCYLHLTSNNTIYGTQYHNFPSINVPLVADMSSDIFSRKIDLSPFSLVYAGAQKNAGTSGVTLIIAQKKFLNSKSNTVPVIFDYNTHAAHQSLYHTPPVFSIYITYLTLNWLKDQGGLETIELLNQKKAAMLYQEIERNACFYSEVAKPDRSLMNVVFQLQSPALETIFIALCEAAGIVGIQGHRSVGGFRASLYNALPVESVEALISVMQALERQSK